MANEYLNNKYLEGLIIKFQKTKKDIIRYEMLLCSLEDNNEVVCLRNTIIDILKHKKIEEKEYHELKSLLAEAFFKLSDNIARFKKFNYIDVDDAIQEGVMICFEKLDRFNPEMGKAFSYMTACIFNHFLQLYRSARNYNELKRKYHEYLESQTTTSDLKSNKCREKTKLAAMKFCDLG